MDTVAQYVRPRYETEETREVEREMASFVSTVWRCEVRKLPVAYSLDYAAIRHHQVVAWMELKRRFRSLTEHDRVFLSMQKVFAAKRLHGYSGMPCFFIVACNDGYFFVDILARQYPIEFRGRTDRNDWQDQEPVIAIPTYEFKPIREAA